MIILFICSELIEESVKVTHLNLVCVSKGSQLRKRSKIEAIFLLICEKGDKMSSGL